MAGMDLSGRRADRGVSVFWMILTVAAAVVALIAILIVGTDAVTLEEGAEEVEHAGGEGGGGDILVNEGQTTVTGRGNTSAASDSNQDNFFGDETVAVEGPTEEGELSVEEVEVDVQPGDPVGGTVVDGDEVGAGVEQGEAVAEDALMGDDAEPVGPGAGDIVVDPDGTQAPFVPTPVGPGSESVEEDEAVAD